MLKITAKPGQGFKKLLADAQAEASRADKATVKALGRFGAIVRQDARKLIGSPVRAPKFRQVYLDDEKRLITITTPAVAPRAPGKPPRARFGGNEFATLRNIRYLPDYNRNLVQIGFWETGVKYSGKSGAELHEFGGRFNTRIFMMRTDATQQDIQTRRKNGMLTRTRKSTRIVPVESRRYGRPVTFNMPKRPTMAPAFDKHKNNMTQIWIDYYNARRR